MNTLKKIEYIKGYANAVNNASASIFDANANVESKNIATLAAELGKSDNIQVNRTLVCEYIEKKFDKQLAEEYVRQIENHEIYIHDETSIMPYCVSINMYPFLKEGIKSLGGESKAPKNLNAFAGSFINLIFAVSSQFAGAVATVEFLMYFDYFARLEFGENYMEELDDIVVKTKTKKLSIRDVLMQTMQQIVYSINQPAAARGYQSVFWNISIFDQFYFESMFGEFVFPDLSKPSYKSLSKLQEFFLSWFNQERTKAVLTFPVVTVAMLTANNDIKDQKTKDIITNELANGNSFFMYIAKEVDSLASCCRLRNELADNTFSYSLGAGGVATGSINVITLNINRVIQLGLDLKTEISKIHKYHVAYRMMLEDFLKQGLLPVYDAGYISLAKQFSTIGINGLVEAAEYLKLEINNNQEYHDFVNGVLEVIYTANKEAKKEYNIMFNTEFVPAENLGVKNAKWDREAGLQVNREIYNSYFYAVEDESLNIIDKFKLHGEEMTKYLDGGSALHLNLEEHLSKEQYDELLKVACMTGCNYFTINVLNTICNDCGHISKQTNESCTKCQSVNIDFATRIIGYLKRISSFSSSRKEEAGKRYYHD
ncbi:MAG: anaerobic ribonucleoside-triphosphate reductase [Mycoplasmatales bacterium]